MPLVPSQRSTTSSRTPGRVNRGTVWSEIASVRICDDCGGVTTTAVRMNQHAPHLERNSRGEFVIVNCVDLPIFWSTP